MRLQTKLIDGYDNYKVVSDGSIIGTTPRFTSKGYLQVTLYDGRLKTYRLHRLIANAFIPNPNNYPQINHIDGDKTNNNVDNLEWCTASHNIRHAISTGLNPRCKGDRTTFDRTQISVIGDALNNGIYQKDIARYFGVHQSTISYLKKREL